MSEAKKYMLLDPSNIDKMAHLLGKSKENGDSSPGPSTGERLAPIKQRETYNLDKKMLDIINNKVLTEEQKVKAYNQALIEFKSLITDKVSTSVSITAPEKGETTLEKVTSPTPDINIDPLITGVPPKFQKKASALLRYLMNSKKLVVTSSGNVVIGGQSIHDSNITDLINKSVNPITPKYHVPGWDSFHSL